MPFSDKHIFFDLDRTLWDFEKNSEIALRHIFEEEQLQNHLPSFDLFHDFYVEENARLWKLYGQGLMTKDVLRYERFRAALHAFFPAEEALIKRIGDAYVEISPRQTALFPNAIETLKNLKSLGFTLHIITNGFQEVQFVKLENSGLKAYFDIIVCSEFIGKNKPDPAIFHHAFELANCKPKDSLMVGDDYYADITGATNAGIQAILFDPELKNTYNYEWVVSDLNEVSEMAIKLFLFK
jgi:putative hydrolase of the HAD superfamily